MGESARSRVHLTAVAVAGYGAVFALLCVLHVPAIAVAVYFVIPTALAAIAGGPAAGAGGAVLSMLLVLAAGHVNAQAAESTAPSASSAARFVALLFTGLLVGWFAARNRSLVGELRLGAERDHLTGLGNNRFFEASVDRRLEARSPFALLLCDMDRLKDVNDGHGHSAGDDALRRLADSLRALAQPDDAVARIGGDEFCIVANVRNGAETASLARRIETRLAVAGCHATLGWATHPGDGTSKAELFRLADERLYARKAMRARALRSLPATG